MSEERVFTREQIVDLLDIPETWLLNLPTEQWENLTSADSVAITRIREHIQTQSGLEYPRPYKKGKLEITNEAELNQLITFLAARNDERLRHEFMVQAEPPYLPLHTEALQTTQAQAEAQSAPAPSNAQQRQVNTSVVSADLPVDFGGGSYRFNKFKEDFYKDLSEEERAKCKEGHYESFKDLKRDTDMWDKMTPEQQAYYESKSAQKDFYPITILLSKTTNADTQAKFSRLANEVKDLEVPTLNRMEAMVEKMFRPG